MRGSILEFHSDIVAALAALIDVPVPQAYKRPRPPVATTQENPQVKPAAEAIASQVVTPEPDAAPQVWCHEGEVKVVVAPKDFITWLDAAIFLAAEGYNDACAAIVLRKLAGGAHNGSAKN